MLKTAPIRAYLPASDVARARKFYEEKLGLVPREEYAGGVIYECGGAEVTAGGAKTAWFKDTEGNTLAVSQRLKRDSQRP
jgi:glyoxalase/bleomycin resistance protein/dioxygenase superfamily protein